MTYNIILLFRSQNLDPKDQEQGTRVAKRKEAILTGVNHALFKKGFMLTRENPAIGTATLTRLADTVEIRNATTVAEIKKLFADGIMAPQQSVIIAGHTYDDHCDISGLVRSLKEFSLTKGAVIYCSPRMVDKDFPTECGTPVTPNMVHAIGWRVATALGINVRPNPKSAAATTFDAVLK